MSDLGWQYRFNERGYRRDGLIVARGYLEKVWTLAGEAKVREVVGSINGPDTAKERLPSGAWRVRGT